MVLHLLSSLASVNAFSSDPNCALHSSLYPKTAVQFPRPHSGRVNKSCAFECNWDSSDIINDTNDCKFNCPTFVEIGSTGFVLGDVNCGVSPGPLASGLDAGLKMKIAKLNKYTQSGSATTANININVTLTQACPTTIKPSIQDPVSRGPFAETVYEKWDSDEKFTLNWNHDTRVFDITADSILGANHAMATIENLIEGINSTVLAEGRAGDLSKMRNLYQGKTLTYGIPFDTFEMKDLPKYPYRGIMIDTARNFVDPKKMLEVIDLMALSKMNVLHWHATDDQSFPLALGSSTAADGTITAFDDANVRPEQAGGFNITTWIHGAECNLATGEYDNCVAAYAPGAVYDRTTIAEIMSHAWLNGINVIMEIDSPSHARSWALNQVAECENNKWDGSTSAMYGSVCESEIAARDGPNSPMGIMCYGLPYQGPAYCAQQLCGPLNMQLANWGVTGGAETFANSFAIDTFSAILNAFDAPVTPELAVVEQRLGVAAGDLAKAFPNAKFVEAGEAFHIGLDEAFPTCLDGEDGTNEGRTARSIEHWIKEILALVSAKNWTPHAWHDALEHYPSLTQSFKDLKVVPQFWSETSTTTWDILTWAENSYVWSPSETAYLDCGLANNAVTGFGSWCRPWKNFFHLYNLDPEVMDEMGPMNDARSLAGLPMMRALGGEVPLWGEQGTINNIIPRLFPRATAAGGALWTGRDAKEINLEHNVLTAFDYSGLNTDDFTDEYEWVALGFNMAHTCHEITPEKTLYCNMDSAKATPFCQMFGKGVYDVEATRTPLPTEEPSTESPLDELISMMVDTQSSIDTVNAIIIVTLVFTIVAVAVAGLAAILAKSIKKNTKVLGAAEVTYIDI